MKIHDDLIGLTPILALGIGYLVLRGGGKFFFGTEPYTTYFEILEPVLIVGWFIFLLAAAVATGFGVLYLFYLLWKGILWCMNR